MRRDNCLPRHPNIGPEYFFFGGSRVKNERACMGKYSEWEGNRRQLRGSRGRELKRHRTVCFGERFFTREFVGRGKRRGSELFFTVRVDAV